MSVFDGAACDDGGGGKMNELAEACGPAGRPARRPPVRLQQRHRVRHAHGHRPLPAPTSRPLRTALQTMVASAAFQRAQRDRIIKDDQGPRATTPSNGKNGHASQGNPQLLGRDHDREPFALDLLEPAVRARVRERHPKRARMAQLRDGLLSGGQRIQEAHAHHDDVVGAGDRPHAPALQPPPQTSASRRTRRRWPTPHRGDGGLHARHARSDRRHSRSGGRPPPASRPSRYEGRRSTPPTPGGELPHRRASAKTRAAHRRTVRDAPLGETRRRGSGNKSRDGRRSTRRDGRGRRAPNRRQATSPCTTLP